MNDLTFPPTQNLSPAKNNETNKNNSNQNSSHKIGNKRYNSNHNGSHQNGNLNQKYTPEQNGAPINYYQKTGRG